MILGEIERAKDSPNSLLSAFFTSPRSDSVYGGVWLVFNHKIFYASVLKSPLHQQSQPKHVFTALSFISSNSLTCRIFFLFVHSQSQILAAALHPITDELVVLDTNGSLWAYSAEFNEEGSETLFKSAQLTSPTQPLALPPTVTTREHIVGFETIGHSLGLMTSEKAYFYDLRRSVGQVDLTWLWGLNSSPRKWVETRRCIYSAGWKNR